VPTPPILRAVVAFVHGLFRARLSLQLEVLALRHQLAVYQRTAARLRLQPADRILWACLSRVWSGWREALVIVKPETVIAWRCRSFRHYWARLSRPGRPGRPPIPREIRDLIRRMSLANPLYVKPADMWS
jgi:putative transposase